MWIDCNGCPVRGTHCDGCMVTGMLATIPLQPPPEVAPAPGAAPSAAPAEVFVDLDASERAAVTTLVASGLLSAEEAATVRARLDLSAAQLWQSGPPRSATG